MTRVLSIAGIRQIRPITRHNGGPTPLAEQREHALSFYLYILFSQEA